MTAMLSDIADDGRLEGLRQAQAIFDRMYRDPDWEGQTPSIGFAATFDQEIDLAVERIKNS